MGIKGLKKVLAKYDLIHPVDVKTLQGKQIGVDLSLIIYQFVAVGVSIGKNYHQPDDKQHKHHISGVFLKTVKLLQQKITPVYFFDGIPPIEKGAVLAARQAARVINVEKGMFDEVADILNLLGVESVRSPSEAEAQAARCVQDGQLYAVLTEDTDVLPLGARMLMHQKGKYYTIDPVEVLQKLQMTRDEFVDFCILLGCDYSPTLPKIGPASALKLIKKYSTIERIIEELKLNPPKEFDYTGARKHFITPVVNPCQLIGREPPSDKLRERLLYYGMTEEKVDKALKVLVELGGK